MTPETSDIAAVHSGAEACVTLKVGVQPECVRKKVQSVLGECFIVSADGTAAGQDAAPQPGTEAGSEHEAITLPALSEAEWGTPFATVEPTQRRDGQIAPPKSTRAFAADFTGLNNNTGLIFSESYGNHPEPFHWSHVYFDESGSLQVQIVTYHYPGGAAQGKIQLGQDIVTFDGTELVGDGTLVVWIEPHPEGLATNVRLSWQGQEIQPVSRHFKGGHIEFINKQIDTTKFDLTRLTHTYGNARDINVLNRATYTTASPMRYYVDVAWDAA